MRWLGELGGGRDPFASSGRAMDSDADESYKMGDKVEARFKGGTRWHPGRIDNVNHDGTYDMRYDDGDEERRVESRMIRKLGGSSPSRRTRLEEGMKIKANYKGKGKMFGGTIKRDNRDGTYDISYDDGDREMSVREADIEAQDGGGGGGGGKLREGDKVEARYRGKSRYYPGRISRDRGDGSYDIDYDDGEQETRVSEELIKPM